ncbi:MAG TPA: enoyl-CoA hydratase [Dehalococcoidia bacterium]|nr:enoyl-CoA hydratase [Dehalococcoidia bacterium]
MELKTDRMLARTEGGIGWMTFNNPEQRNAMKLEMQEAVPEILGAFAADDDVRVVVMHGVGGKAFVSGADISEFEERRSSPEAIAEYDAIGARAGAAYAKLGKPLIAMIEGFAMGGGLLTAMRADLRIASDNSTFGVPAARLGLGYSFESVDHLVNLVGAAHAREILITGGRFDAADAMRMGLVNRVVPAEELESTVRELAGTIAENAPLTLKSVRVSIGQALNDEATRDRALVDRLIEECFASEDYIEGRHAFMEKRTPQFRGH